MVIRYFYYKKSKKVISLLILFVICIIGLNLTIKQVFAKQVTTSVTVGNSAPQFTVTPAESVGSDTTNPTNVGANITFNVTAKDKNNDKYFLAICKTNAITPGASNAAPTCGGGNWCISTATNSESQSSCSYSTVQGDNETNDWYAFVCDQKSSSSACSAMSQGNLDATGSPFIVNHPPVFLAIGNTTPINPGSTETWTTNVGTSDTDASGVADTVKLVVCKTEGVSNAACDGGAGDTWCSSSLVANNPNCSYSIPIPTSDTTYNAYVYLFDSHNLAATGVNQGASKNYIVNNIVPVVSAITINGGSNINLNEGNTQPVVLGATVTDNNGCNDISVGGVTAYLYRSGIGYSGCDTSGEADANNCYPEISCSTSDCSTDAHATYSCNVSLKYFAEPTDGTSSSDGPYYSENWKDTFKAVDNNSLVGVSTVSTGVEMISMVGMDTTGEIQFGSMSAGDKTDPLDKIVIVTATGNVGLNTSLKGTDLSDGTNTIAVTNQRYSKIINTTYDTGTSLTTSYVTLDIQIPKTNADIANTKPSYWGISIPEGTIAGSYSGTNDILAVKYF